jgi:hypothetical protein
MVVHVGVCDETEVDREELKQMLCRHDSLRCGW